MRRWREPAGPGSVSRTIRENTDVICRDIGPLLYGSPHFSHSARTSGAISA